MISRQAPATMSVSWSNSTASTGNVDCPCINQTSALSSLVKRSCPTAEGQDGVMLTTEGPCVPYSYGSSSCQRHDGHLTHNCTDGTTDCGRPWCYVDASTCSGSSSERIHRSSHFSFEDDGVDLFYSYTTCGPFEEEFVYHENAHPLGGRSIMAGVPAYWEPFQFKRSDSGDILFETGDEYYDNRVNFEGIVVDYLRELEKISKGDLNITFTHGSRGGRRVHNASIWAGILQDVHDEVLDIGAGTFWVTRDRLKMATFSVPIDYDRTVLVVKKPESSIEAEIGKVLSPFGTDVWILITGLILCTALLSVWFSREKYGRHLKQRKRPDKIKKSLYSRLLLDEFLQKGMFFCSAGVEQDNGASLPHKFLMFGFAAFILVVVSCYVANLAAFLTRPSEFMGTMEAVIQHEMSVCIEKDLKDEVEAMWGEDVNFVYLNGNANLLSAFDNGTCDVLAVSDYGIRFSTNGLVTEFCRRNLVVTESVVLKYAMAFPAKPELAAGLSYWMAEGERDGATLEFFAKQYNERHRNWDMCDVSLGTYLDEANEYAQINVENLFFPIIFFLCSAAIAILLQLFQLYHQSKQNSNTLQRSYLGRTSRFVKKASSRRVVKRDSFEDEQVPDGVGETARSLPPRIGFEGKPAPDGVGETARSLPPGIGIRWNEVDLSAGEQARPAVRFADDDIPEDFRMDHALALEAEYPSDDFHESQLDNLHGISINQNDEPNSASNRFHHLVETGALDELFHCYQDVKRQKQN